MSNNLLHQIYKYITLYAVGWALLLFSIVYAVAYNAGWIIGKLFVVRPWLSITELSRCLI